jgi:hypothetical protein
MGSGIENGEETQCPKPARATWHYCVINYDALRAWPRNLPPRQAHANSVLPPTFRVWRRRQDTRTGISP